MTRKDEYVEELVMTVMRMFDDGISDPSCQEICEEHFPGKHIPGEIIASVKQRLPRIKTMLDALGYEVYFVNLAYYARFRSVEPLNDVEAKERLPIGGGANKEKSHRYGIKLCESPETDEMWQATMVNNLSTANGKRDKAQESVAKAVTKLGLTNETAQKLLSGGTGLAV